MAPERQEWRLEVGRTGTTSRLWLNGVPIHPCRVEVCIEANQRTTLRLYFPEYGEFGRLAGAPPPVFHPRDTLIIVNSPSDVNEGESSDGLFGTGRRGRAADQSL